MGNTYLMHYAKGGESKNHKYVSRKKGSNGKWVYFYGDNGHAAKKDKMTVQGDEVDVNTADDYLELIKKYGVAWGNGKRIGYGDIKDVEMYPVKNKYGVISYNMQITTKDGEKRTLKMGVKDGEDETSKAHRDVQKIRKDTEEQLGGKYNRKTHQVRKYQGSKRYLGNTTRSYRKTQSSGSGVKLKKPSIFATHSDEFTEELYHYAKGGESKNHKYKSRYKKNGVWHYVYDAIGGKAEREYKYAEGDAKRARRLEKINEKHLDAAMEEDKRLTEIRDDSAKRDRENGKEIYTKREVHASKVTRDKLLKAAESANTHYKSRVKLYTNAREAEKKSSDLKKKYDKTILGRTRKAKNNIKNKANSAKKSTKDFISSFSSITVSSVTEKKMRSLTLSRRK